MNKKNKNDDIINILGELSNKIQNIENKQKIKDLEGTIAPDNKKEEESQMFTISRDYKDITGELDGLLTKTRFDDNSDVANTIEPIVTRFYMGLQRTRYGGSHIFIPIEDIESKKIDISELEGFEIYPEPIEFNNKKCIEIFIDIASIRTRLILKGRFASQGGKARLEKIHDSVAKFLGQPYIEKHVPPSNIYVPGYGQKNISKTDVAQDILLEDQ